VCFWRRDGAQGPTVSKSIKPAITLQVIAGRRTRQAKFADGILSQTIGCDLSANHQGAARALSGKV
jgi:hypothetical protein